jgi:hypothetical protein
MKRLLLQFVLIPTIILGQTREKEVQERVVYFKSHAIFVTQLTLDQKALRRSSEEEIEQAKSKIEKFNKNIRTAFDIFWSVNDTVIFVFDNELKSKKKQFKSDIFFELVKIGEQTNDKGQVLPVTAFRLSRPDKADYLKNVLPRLGIDTSLVNIVTELRQLKLNVTTGDIMMKKDFGRKVILINKDDQMSKLGENYVDLIRSKNKTRIMDVDNKFVLEALMRKDPRYIYIKNGSAFNVEDGTLIP